MCRLFVAQAAYFSAFSEFMIVDKRNLRGKMALVGGKKWEVIEKSGR